MISAHNSEGSSESDEFVPYYDQLDANGKAIYDAMNHADTGKTTLRVELPVALTAQADTVDDAKEYITTIINNTFREAFSALRLSSPLAFWTWASNVVGSPSLDLSNILFVNNAVTLTSITLNITCTTPADKGIQDMLNDINSAVEKFKTSSTSERDIVMDINNYLVNLVTYDPNFDKSNASIYDHDLYGVFVDPKHYAVCDGYSEAFLLLCEKENIDCVMVLGTALPEIGAHAWNYVKMDDGKWYAIDVTWNDDGSGDNPYFLKGADTFFTDHQQGVYLDSGISDYPFNSPVLSGTAYDKAPATVDYLLYSYIFVILIIAVLFVVLYTHAKRGR